MQIIKPVVEYHQLQFQKTAQTFHRDAPSFQIARYMRSATGANTHVDICLYGVLHRLTAVDIEYIKRLSVFVNVVPVILKCDTLRAEELFQLKSSILSGLIQAKVDIYGFGLTMNEMLILTKNKVPGCPPFSFCDPALSDDLRPGSGESEFEQLKKLVMFTLVEEVRASAANKYVQWREDYYRTPRR